MIYGSLCSGIEAATCAWESLGWKPAWFSEIEKFPCELLKYYYPNTPNLGDMTKIYDNDIFRDIPIDLIVGGTPCQDFSMAGQRAGAAGSKGQLTHEFVRILKVKQPKWFVWENVRGVLSSNKGLDFGSFLRSIQECGYGFAYRVLDAQYFGVAQRRKRIFVVGHLGDWTPAIKVLFEQESRDRNLETPEKTKKTIQNEFRITTNNGKISKRIANVLVSTYHKNYYASECLNNLIVDKNGIRRLTPLEFERLMGFNDGYTLIPTSNDSNRYKALGNSMVVPVMRWIGNRIDKYEKGEL